MLLLRFLRLSILLETAAAAAAAAGVAG